MRIDVHAHYNPAVLVEAYGRVIGGRAPFVSKADLDPHIEAMNEAGIDRQIFWSNFQPNVLAVGVAVDSAKLVNDVYSEQAAKYGGRIDAWGAVPLPHVDEAIAEAARCLDELGFAGIGLGCSILDKPLDAAEFEPFWAELDRRHAVVFIHAGQACKTLPGAEEFSLTQAFMWPAETAVAGVRLVHTGVTERYPNIRFILAGGGGLIPGFQTTLDYLHGKIGGAPKTRLSLKEGLARLFYDTSVREAAQQLGQLKDLCGVENIVFGSDAPFGSMSQMAKMIEDHFAPEAADKILNKNAAAILKSRG